MLIGQPKTLDDFPSLTPQEAQYLAVPILQALQSGHPVDTSVQVDFGVICQLLATVKRFALEIERLSALVPAPETEEALPVVEERTFPTILRPFPPREE